MRLKIWVVAMVSMLAAIGFAQSGSQASVDSSAVASTPSVDRTKIHLDQLLGRQTPMGAQFKDWDGSTVSFGKLFGTRPVILVPIWYNCTGVCNVELQSLLNTIPKVRTRTLGKDYDVVVLSINPTEGPELAAAKRRNVLNTVNLSGTEMGWHFLTGTMQNIEAVTNSVGFHFVYDPVKNFANHPSGIIVLTPSGQVSSYMYGAVYAPATLQADIDIAKQGRVGAKTEEIFFGCVHVDPITGHRSIVIENVLRLMGVVTVIAILGSILTLSGKKLIHRSAVAG